MYRGNEVKDLVEAAVAEAKMSTNGWYRGACPVCVIEKGTPDKKRSLGFRPENGFFYCMRCGVRGFLRGDFHLMASRVAHDAAESDKPPEDLDPPEGFMPLAREPARSAIITEEAREYLLERHVTKNIWREAHIGITFTGWHNNRIIVPIISTVTDQWVGWVGRLPLGKRDIPEGVLAYRYPLGMKRGQMMWNSEILSEETDEPAVLVEGVFDGLPHWPHATACLGKPSRGHWHMLVTARRPLVIALDGDSWMEAEALARRLRFKKRRAAFIRLPPCTDPGDLQPGELIDMARRAL
jgi:hypothetical protein